MKKSKRPEKWSFLLCLREFHVFFIENNAGLSYNIGIKQGVLSMQIDISTFNFDCPVCGAHHGADVKQVVIETGAFSKLEEVAKSLGLNPENAVAVYDTNTTNVVPHRTTAKQEVILPAEDLHANERGVGLLEKMADQCEYFIAIGSGSLTDITRYIAFQRGVPFISCPTACSVDGFASNSCAMTLKGVKTTVYTRMPIAIVADTEILRNSPMKLTRSGFGDMVGKYTSVADWKISGLFGADEFCQNIADIQMKAVREVIDSCALLGEKDPGAYEKLMYGLILSGLAMQMFGTTRPASGPEHHMSHCWEMGVLAHTDALHGEKVGVATLIVSKKYHEVLRQGISYLDTLLPNLEMMPKASLRKVIGEELWPLIEEQNAKDTLEGLTVDIIREKWDELTAIMATIPPYEELLEIYNSIGAMTTMEEIGLSDDLIDKSFMFAPYIRNRFTFMRIMSRKINNEFVTE